MSLWRLERDSVATPFSGTAMMIAQTAAPDDWQRLLAGAGTKGPRLHDWCYLELADLKKNGDLKADRP